MTAETREQQFATTFIQLADTLVDDYDVVDLLHTLVEKCTHLLGAADAGILLPDNTGALSVVASTSERSHLIGLLQLDAGEGPCVDAYETGNVVAVEDIAATYARWPTFATEAATLNYKSMYAIPLRLRAETIGSLNLFSDQPGPLDDTLSAAARAFADIATIGILHERTVRESDIARQQLQRALDSRVVIEQAKGIISHSDQVTMDEAFAKLRAQARSTNQRLSDVARQTIDAARGA
jgi:transcriptional regulator with GAF, ATPase, and Fis domain